MAERMQKTTPFKDGRNTTDKGKDAPKVPVLSDASKDRFSPGHDPLMQSISAGIPDIPMRYHMGDIVAHINPKGVNYNPAGEFGRIEGPTAKGTDYEPHTSKPGKNALGEAMNRVGQKSGYPKGGKKSGGGGKHV